MKKSLTKLLKNKTFLLGMIIFLSVLFVAVFAERLATFPYDEMHISDALKAPNDIYKFGTDQYGRDIYSRIIYGTRITLKVGTVVVLIETIIGVLLGVVAGYYGGFRDRVITFVTDLVWALPPVVMALAIVTMLGPSLNNVIISIAVVSWAQFTRIVRVKTQGLKNLPYIEAAKAYGENDFNIIMRYILPNVAGSIIVLASLALPSAILSTTSLGFLGLGSQPPEPDWGLILKEGINYINNASWITIFPGLSIVYTVLGLNLLGEGLRDIMDPRLKA